MLVPNEESVVFICHINLLHCAPGRILLSEPWNYVPRQVPTQLPWPYDATRGDHHLASRSSRHVRAEIHHIQTIKGHRFLDLHGRIRQGSSQDGASVQDKESLTACPQSFSAYTFP